MPEFVVDWTSRLLSAGWRVPEPGREARDFLFSKRDLRRTPRRVHDATTYSRFERLVSSSAFTSWWLQKAAGGSRRAAARFLLRFPPGIWSIPWELLIRLKEQRLEQEHWARVSIIRCVEGPAIPHPSRLERSLRVLMVLGDENPLPGLTLDLAREATGVRAAYDALPRAVRECFAAPEMAQPTLSELPAVLKRHGADILWFSGHAEAQPARFRLRGTDWLTPSSLEHVLDASGTAPAFAVFWACETARTCNRAAALPPLCEVLIRRGVMAVLAMQDSVSDEGAILMASELFEALAAGRSLDVATAHARAAMLEASVAGLGNPLDWACPTVWASGLSNARLRWATPSTGLAQLQVSMRRRRRVDEGASSRAPNQDELAAAERWLGSPRTWIRGSSSPADTTRWTMSLLAMQHHAQVFAIAVELQRPSSQPLAAALISWAEAVLAALEPGDAPRAELRAALDEIRGDVIAGWSHLCSLEGAVIGISFPHGTDRWFWDPLDATQSTVVVLSDAIPATVLPDRWSLEDIGMRLDPAGLATAASDVVLLGVALSLLRVPVTRLAIETCSTAAALATLEPFLVSLDFGDIALTGAAARKFRETASVESLRMGHRLCMQILDDATMSPRLSRTLFREERLHHALEAQEGEAVGSEATALMVRYRDQDRPVAARNVMRRAKAHWRSMSPTALIYAAWADIMLGELDDGAFWLDRAVAADAFEAAWIHGLRAEFAKARAEKDIALQEIEAAIAALANESSAFAAHRRRAYRQDRARILQYLFRETGEAERQYRELLEEWRDDPEARVDRAIVRRNLAECIRGVVRSETWRASRNLLATAEQEMAGDLDEHPILAEIKYEQARMAFAEGDLVSAEQLLEDCDRAAARADHRMLAAIVASRRFWLSDTFDELVWRRVAARLSAFPSHGWAVRTLIDGRLRAAKQLEVRDRDAAARELRLCQEALVRNPAFDTGSDRLRIAATAAGLDMLGDASVWTSFRDRSWATEWMATGTYDGPISVWAAVT